MCSYLLFLLFPYKTCVSCEFAVMDQFFYFFELYRPAWQVKFVHFFHSSLKISHAFDIEGCPTYVIRNGSPNWWWLVTDREDLSCLSDRDMSVIECRPPHLYDCLWGHYFRMRNIPFVTLYFACQFVLFAGCHNPSRTVTYFGDPLQIECIGHVCWNLYRVCSLLVMSPHIIMSCYCLVNLVDSICHCTALSLAVY